MRRLEPRHMPCLAGHHGMAIDLQRQALAAGKRREIERSHEEIVRIDEHHANQIIHITGWNESVPAWLKSADVLLFPSWTEGSPNVVLEAMACGCPIVASNIPPIAEMIKTHVYGTLCPPSDRAAFVAAVENVLRDRDQAQSRAKAAQAHVTREHAMESVITRWRKLYDDLMAVSGSVL